MKERDDRGTEEAFRSLGNVITALREYNAAEDQRRGETISNLGRLLSESKQEADELKSEVASLTNQLDAARYELAAAVTKARDEAFAECLPFRNGSMLPVECRSAEALCALAKIAGADVSVDLMAGIKGAVRVVVTCERIGEKFDQLKAERNSLAAAQPAKREWKVGDKARCYVRGAGLRTTPMPVTVIADLGQGWITVELVGFPYADAAVVHETWLLPPSDEA